MIAARMAARFGQHDGWTMMVFEDRTSEDAAFRTVNVQPSRRRPELGHLHQT